MAGTHMVTHIIRACVVVSLALLALLQPAADDVWQAVWSYLSSTRFVRHDSCEPVVASVSFFVWITMFRVWDRITALRKFLLPGVRRRKGTERVAHLCEKLSKGNLTLSHDSWSLLAYLVVFLTFDFVYPRRKLPVSIPGVVVCGLQLLGTLFVYDFYFFWLHLAMHKFRWLRKLHAVHHGRIPMFSSDVVRHGALDGAAQVACNILALWTIGAHPLVRIVHNIVVTYLLTEAHAGYDMPWMLHRVVPFDLYGGALAHEQHHRLGNVCFHQFFTYLDHALGHSRLV